MNYEIQIHDMENLSDPLIVHYASRDSISLQYEGGEEPDKVIDGSTALFDLETLFGEDFKYGQYFTSNEKKYRVTWVIEETQEIVWRGFILPETFTEPYDYPLFYTKFEAVCGLGLLKGKELSDDFYSEEKTVIEVISACLKLTKIDFDIYLTPAINNSIQENWNTIYIDMLKYEDEDKRPSAYEILDDLLYSKLCKVYQCEGRWYIEGFNRRNLPKNKFFKYDINGAFLGTQVIEKNVKELKHFVDGPAAVSMVPALGRLTVSHESPVVEFPQAVYKEEDLDWVPPLGLNGSFYPREWIMYGDWKFSTDISVLPLMRSPEYFLRLFWNKEENFRPQNKISLKKKLFLLEGTRLQIKIRAKFKNGNAELGSESSQENYDRGNYNDALIYRIKLNENVLFSTLPGDAVEPQPMNLDAQGRGEIQFDFITGDNGYLDMEFWEPYGDIYAFTAPRLYFEEISIKNLQQRENDVVSMIVDEDSSVTKDIELPVSDDISANSICFMLEPIRDLDASESRTFKVPVLYGYALNGENYAIVDLKGAVLMELYPDEVTWNSYLLTVKNFEVIYNLNGTPEMAIKTTSLITDGNFFVVARPLAAPTTNRLDWLKWTDAVYGVEQKPFAEVVAEIYRRLFQVPRLKLSGTTEAPYKYNDLIKFNYNGEERYFAFSNLEWRPSGGTGVSTFTAFEAFYEGVSVGNVPPYVYAGPDITITGYENRVQVTEAVVNDPDGGTPSLLWERHNVPPGTPLAVFSNPNALNPEISNLVLDYYEFKLTATDEAGNTASDIMVITRPDAHDLVVDNYENIEDNGSTKSSTSNYRLSFDPVLPAGSAIKASFKILVDINAEKGDIYQFATSVFKNGNIVYSYTTGINYYNATHNFNEVGNFQMEAGTDVVVQHYIWHSNDFRGNVRMKMSFTTMEFLNETEHVITEPYDIIEKFFVK